MRLPQKSKKFRTIFSCSRSFETRESFQINRFTWYHFLLPRYSPHSSEDLSKESFLHPTYQRPPAGTGVPPANNGADFNCCRDTRARKNSVEVGFILLLEVQHDGTALLRHAPKGGCSIPLSLICLGLVKRNSVVKSSLLWGYITELYFTLDKHLITPDRSAWQQG